MKWWEYHTVHEYFQRLATYLSGDLAYRVEFAPGSGQSFINFQSKLIVVDPNLHPWLRPEGQFKATRACLEHEVAHRLFTTPQPSGDPQLHSLANLLEDERVERALGQLAPGTAPDFRFLKQQLKKDAPRLREADDPQEVVLALFHRRLSGRIRGKLSPENRGLLRRVWPLAKTAFSARDSEEVYDLAGRILEILRSSRKPMGDPSPDLQIEACPGCLGERVDAPLPAFDTSASPIRIASCETPLRYLVPSGPDGDRADHLAPMPYLELLGRALPQADRLVQHLRRLQAADEELVYADQGGRLSVTAWVRHQDRPFRRRLSGASAELRIALGCLVDCSGSMCGSMDSVKPGVMMLHLACSELAIDHAVWAFSSWREPVRVVKGFEEQPTFAPAYIAGLEASGGTRLLPALRGVVPLVAHRDVDVKLLLVIHDGEPEEREACRRYIAVQTGTSILGVYIGDADNASRMRELFAGNLIATAPETLPEALGGFLVRLVRS